MTTRDPGQSDDVSDPQDASPADHATPDADTAPDLTTDTSSTPSDTADSPATDTAPDATPTAGTTHDPAADADAAAPNATSTAGTTDGPAADTDAAMTPTGRPAADADITPTAGTVDHPAADADAVATGTTPTDATNAGATDHPAAAADSAATPTGRPAADAAAADTTTADATNAGTTDHPTADADAAATPTDHLAADADRDSMASHAEGSDEEPTASARFPFGRPGRPFRQSPFLFGLTGALGVFVAWGLVQALVNVRQVVVLLVVALFLAVGLNPAVEFLQRRKIPRVWAVTLVFIGLLVFVAGFVSAIVPPLVQQANELWESRNEYLNALQNNPTINRLDDRYNLLDTAQTYLNENASNLSSNLASGLLGAGRAIASGVFNTFSVLILTLYFLASLPKIKRAMYRLAPRTRRERVTLLGDEIITRVGGYVSGAAVIVFIAGLTTYIWLLIWQVPYALPLALCVMLLGLIPMIGATIGGVLVTLVAFTAGLPTGIATAIFYVGYQQLENYLIYPRVMKRAVALPAALTVIAILVGGTLLGVLGALLAIPTAAALLLLYREVVVPRIERA